MQPVHELLNRIRWDPKYGRSEFEIGYLDRVAGTLIRVPFTRLIFPKDEHFSFSIIDSEGELHNVPFHRVKQVYRDGELIWHREH